MILLMFNLLDQTCFGNICEKAKRSDSSSENMIEVSVWCPFGLEACVNQRMIKLRSLIRMKSDDDFLILNHMKLTQLLMAFEELDEPLISVYLSFHQINF
jgi:hypothetical protein